MRQPCDCAEMYCRRPAGQVADLCAHCLRDPVRNPNIRSGLDTKTVDAADALMRAFAAADTGNRVRLMDTVFRAMREAPEMRATVGPEAGHYLEQLATQRIHCKLCRRSAPEVSAHRHQDGWVCEDCWDERLRSTE